MEGIDYAYMFSNCPHLVKQVFRLLNSQTLNSCSQVCKLWNNIAESEKKRRNNFYWIFHVDASTDGVRDADTRYEKSPTKMSTIFNMEMKNLKLEPVFCIALASLQCYNHIQQYFPPQTHTLPQTKRFKASEKRKYLQTAEERLAIEGPAGAEAKYVAVRVVSRRDEVGDIQVSAMAKKAVRNLFEHYLPHSCKITFTVASGIVGCFQNCLPFELEEEPALTALFLPALPEMQVHHFAIENKYSDLDQFLSGINDVKCVLMFMAPRGQDLIDELFTKCYTAERAASMAVGGGLVLHTESLLGSVIAFSGTNVEAASIVINQKDKRREIEEKLKLFEKTGLLKNRCFAYMFACVGRGKQLHGNENVESSVFAAMCPGVPLFGIFANGEIGVNCLPNVAIDNSLLKYGIFAKQEKIFLRSYTTIFVLVSVKV